MHKQINFEPGKSINSGIRQLLNVWTTTTQQPLGTHNGPNDSCGMLKLQLQLTQSEILQRPANEIDLIGEQS
jgi:hypothetical protein